MTGVIRNLATDLKRAGLISELVIHRGDNFQVLVHDTRTALQTAMLFKTVVNKTFKKDKSRLRGEKVMFDINVSLGLGDVPQNRPISGQTGPPFLLSDKGLEYLRSNRQTVGVFTGNSTIDRNYENLFFLYQWIMGQWSLTSAELVYYKLWGLTEREIAAEIGISQPAVNQRSQAACWSGLERILATYRELEERFLN